MQEHRPAFLNVSEAEDVITAHSSAMEKMEEITLHNRAVVEVLERHVVNITCDDPGLKLTSQVIRPILQERIESAARAAAEEKAAQAQRDLGIIEVSNPPPARNVDP